jgi:hypothetical protein
MLAGRQPFYAARERLVEGRRGHVCPDAACACGGFVDSDPNAYDASGEPAHPWFAVYTRTGSWQLTGHEVRVRCSDGGNLLGDPLKVLLVSAPSEGRVWRKLTPTEVAAAVAE